MRPSSTVVRASRGRMRAISLHEKRTQQLTCTRKKVRSWATQPHRGHASNEIWRMRSDWRPTARVLDGLARAAVLHVCGSRHAVPRDQFHAPDPKHSDRDSSEASESWRRARTEPRRERARARIEGSVRVRGAYRKGKERAHERHLRKHAEWAMRA